MSAVQIEEKVVKMTFDNSTFDSKIAASKMALENFKKALNFNDETTQSTQQAVNSLKNIISSVNFSGIENSLDTVSSRFSMMGIVGMNVINKLTDGVLNLGQKILFAIPNQIKTGGWNRAMNVADAKFQLSGLEVAWEDVADAIDHAVLGTAYGADAAAKAAAQLATTGVNYKNAIKDASGNVEVWDDMARSLRAISGVAAMTNSSYEEIADVFTSIAGAGKAQLGELNRLSYRGLRAQNAIADHLGVSLQEVDQLISKGKIDFQTFADAMDEAFGEHATRADVTLRGSMDNMKASLSRIGQDFAQTIFTEVPQVFNAIKGFFNKIRTFTRPFADNIFTPVFAFYMDKVRTIIENVTNKIPTLEKGSKALEDYNRVLKSLGHITTSVIRSVINIGKMFDPIKKAFTDVFGLPSIEQLEKFGNSIVQFSHRLKLNSEVADNVRRTFRGFFSAIKIIGDAFTQIGGKIIPPVISLFKKAAENVLKLTAAFGDYVTNLEESISKNRIFAKVTEKTIEIVRSASTILKGFFSGIADKFKSFFSSLSIDTSIFNNFFSNVADKFRGTISWIAKLGEKFKGIMPIFSAIGQGIGNITKQLFSGLFSAIETFVKSSSYLNLLDLIKGILLTDMTVNFGVFIKRVLDMFGGGAMTLRNVFGLLTDLKNTLIVFQTEVRANIIRSIAISLGILAASLYVISTIDTEKVIIALGAISAMMYGLMLALSSFKSTISDMMDLDTASGQFTGFIGSIMKLFGISTGTAKYATLSFTMMAIGAAILELSVAIKIIASCPIEKAAAALGGILLLMKAMTQVIQKLGAVQAKFIPGSLAMVALATSMVILAKAIKMLSDLSLEQVGVGLLAVAGGLTGLVLALIAISKFVENPVAIGSMIGLIAMAGSIYILGKAIAEIATIPWENLQVALVAVGLCLAAMTAVAVALNFVPLAAVGGLAFVEMATAIYIVGITLSKLSEISWDKLENALNALATCLKLLSISAIALSFASPLLIITAPGLIALAVALTMLTPALLLLATVPAADLGKAVGMLTAMVLAFSGLSLAGILTPLMLGLAASIASLAKSILILVPALIALSAVDMETINKTAKVLRKFIHSMELLSIGASIFLPAFLALSAGMAALAVSMMLIASGANAFMAAFDGVITYLGGATVKIAEFIVKLAEDIGKGFYNALQDNGDGILLALADIINKLATAIEESVDVLLPALNNLVESLFYAIGELITDVPAIISAALKGLGRAFGVEQEILDGFDEAAEAANAGLASLFDSLFANIKLPLNDLGYQLGQGLRNAILANLSPVEDAGAQMGRAAITGIRSKKGIDSHSPSIESFLCGTYVGLGFINGMAEFLPKVLGAGENVGKTAIKGIKSGVEQNKKDLDNALNFTYGKLPENLGDQLHKQVQAEILDEKKNKAITYSAKIGYKLDVTNKDDINDLYELAEWTEQNAAREKQLNKEKEELKTYKKLWEENAKAREEYNGTVNKQLKKQEIELAAYNGTMEKQLKKQELMLAAQQTQLEEKIYSKKYSAHLKRMEEDISDTAVKSYKESSRSLDEYYDKLMALEKEYEKIDDWGLSRYADRLKKNQVQHIFGNVDMDKRTVIKWNEDYVSQWEDALKSWELFDDAGNIIGSKYDEVASAIENGEDLIDTVWGGYDTFKLRDKEIDVSYTPIMVDKDGKNPQFLSEGTVQKYIQQVLDKADKEVRAAGNTWTPEAVYKKALEIDLTGLNVDNVAANGKVVGKTYVNSIISAVDDYTGQGRERIQAETVSMLTHFTGAYGALQLAADEVSIAQNGITKSAEEAMKASEKSARVQQMAAEKDLENTRVKLEQQANMYRDNVKNGKMAFDDYMTFIKENDEALGNVYSNEQQRIQEHVNQIKLANESNAKSTEESHARREQSIHKLTLKEEQMSKQMEKTTEVTKNKNTVFLHAHDAERALKEQTEKHTGALIENKRALKENGEQMDATAKKAKALKDEMKEMHDSIEKSLESKTGGMNFFNKLELKSETTAATILENMQSNVDGVASWTARLGQLMDKGLNKELVKTLADAGLSSYDQISAFLQMTDEQIAHANELFLKAAEGRAYSANTISSKYFTLGQDNMQGLIDGTASKEQEVVDNTVKVEERAHKEVEALDGHNSPSKWWIQLGEDNMQGLDLGMLEGAEKYVFANVIYIANRIHSICKEQMTGQSSEIYNIGLNFSKGLAQGILDGEDGIVGATKRVTSLIPKESKGVLEEASPSKLAFRIGRFFDMGLINGLTDLQNELKMTSRNVASSAVDPMMDTFNDAGKLLGNNLDFNPVIKPSFDISEVTNGMANVSSMFDKRRSIEVEAQANSWTNPSVRDSFLDTFANRIGMEYADRVVDAINNKDMNANVHLEGDAEGIFKVVRKGNRAFMRRTGYSGI